MIIDMNREDHQLLKLVRNASWVIGLLVLLCLWIAAVHFGWVGKTLIASPAEVWTTLVSACSFGSTKPHQLYIHLLHTLLRAMQGWLIACGFGIALGVVLGRIAALYSGSEPIVEFVRAIPPILVFPLFLVAFNYEEGAYVWTIVFGCVPVMLLTVAYAAMNIPRQKLEILAVFGAKRAIRFFATAMEIVPGIFLGARLTFSLALVIAVVTDMVFTPRSGWAIGALARDSEMNFDTPTYYTCMLLVGCVGYFGNLFLKKIEQKFGMQGRKTDSSLSL